MMDVLHKRHIRDSSRCSVCGHDEEIIFHTIFECKYGVEMWLHSDFRDLLLDAPCSSFVDRFVWMEEKLSKTELATFASIAWAAWFARNKAIFEGEERSNALNIAVGFVKMKADYCRYKDKVHQQAHIPREPAVSSWSPPPTSFVKLNVDAHVPHEGGVSFGMVLRDEWGSLLAAGVKRLSVNWKPDMAEAGAVRFGLEVVRSMGFENMVLESDALSVVRAIVDRRRGAAPIFLFFEDIFDISLSFSNFRCVHVKRSGNTVAHSVARWDAVVGTTYVCTNLFPQSLQTLVALDLI